MCNLEGQHTRSGLSSRERDNVGVELFRSQLPYDRAPYLSLASREAFPSILSSQLLHFKEKLLLELTVSLESGIVVRNSFLKIGK